MPGQVSVGLWRRARPGCRLQAVRGTRSRSQEQGPLGLVGVAALTCGLQPDSYMPGTHLCYTAAAALAAVRCCSAGAGTAAAAGPATPATPATPSPLELRYAHQPLLRQAFISHTGQHDTSRVVATFLAKQLKSQGVQRFIDYDALNPGSDWSEELERHAQLSKVMVLLLSPDYFSRYWCMRELDLAMAAWRSRRDSRRDTIIIIPVCCHPGLTVGDVGRVQQEWRQAWEALAAEGRPHVDVARWAEAVRDLGLHHQAKAIPFTTAGGTSPEATGGSGGAAETSADRRRAVPPMGKNAEVQLVDTVAARVWEVLPALLHIAECRPFGPLGAKEEVLRLLEEAGAVLVAGAGGGCRWAGAQ